jgi:dTDP-4-dehydrorhamnose reductase
MRVLVTGVSGLIGSNVAAAAAQQSWEVLGGWKEVPVRIDGVECFQFDMADRKACVSAAMRFEPDVIVHAAGGVALTRFERDPYIAQLDLVGAEHTLAAARAVRARYVLVSCDWVHSGYRPPGLSFSESDPPEPVNAYGHSKLMCEQAAMRSNVSWLITRVGDAYGINMGRPVGNGDGLSRHVWRRSGVALGLVRRLRGYTPLPVPVGVYRSPTYAWDYGQRVCELIAQGCEGIYNTAGPEGLARREWIELLGRRFGCADGLVRDGTRAAFLQACGEDARLRLPPNTTLSGEKSGAAIGAPAVSPEEGARLMCEQLRKTLHTAGSRAR